jgi:sulfide:quinone oxidoreductase
MKQLVILGAGTSGTIMANHLSKKLSSKEWNITIVDQEETHYYNPDFCFYLLIYTNRNSLKTN